MVKLQLLPENSASGTWITHHLVSPTVRVRKRGRVRHLEVSDGGTTHHFEMDDAVWREIQAAVIGQ